MNGWRSKPGGQSIRFDTYQGELDVTFIQLDEKTESEINKLTINEWGHLDYRSWIIPGMSEFQDAVAPQPGKIYIAFTEFEQHQTYWGASTGTGYMFLYPRAWLEIRPAMHDYPYAFEFLVLHELVHEFGFVAECAKNYNGNNGGHTGDDNQDLMWAPPGDSYYVESYTDYGNMTLDYGNDDYFNHNIRECPDLADSVFLTPTSENGFLPEWLDHLAFPE